MSYYDMTRDQIVVAAQLIARQALTEEELRRRLREELGYPYGEPTIDWRARGMVAIMMHHHDGTTISIWI